MAAANAGRDRELADVEATLLRKRGAYAAAINESGGRNGPALRARLRERELVGGSAPA